MGVKELAPVKELARADGHMAVVVGPSEGMVLSVMASEAPEVQNAVASQESNPSGDAVVAGAYCGQCVMCLDMPRFGGPGIKRRACLAVTQAPKAALGSALDAPDPPLMPFPKDQAMEVISALEQLKASAETASEVCHGWSLSYRMRQPKKGSPGPAKAGDFVIIDPRDNRKIFSILGVKRKLGLIAPEDHDVLQPTHQHVPEADEAHERQLLDNLEMGAVQCFASFPSISSGPWYHAKLLGTRSRQPQFHVEFTRTLDGKEHASALPQPRMKHLYASAIRLEPPPPPPPPPILPKAPVKVLPPKAPPSKPLLAAMPFASGGGNLREYEHPSTWSASRVDQALFRGAAALGWRVDERHPGSARWRLFRYISPTGQAFKTRTEARANVPGSGASSWLERSAEVKQSRLGGSYQAELPTFTLASVQPYPATPPMCWCAQPAAWAYRRWWCADEQRGCAFELVPPPIERTPLCWCGERCVWEWRDEHFYCSRPRPEGRCDARHPPVPPDAVRPAEPEYQSSHAIEVAYAKRLAADLTSAAYEPEWPRTDPADPLGSDGDGDDDGDDEALRCLNCGNGDHDELMLLCDGAGCSGAYHTFCLVPPLQGVPLEEWYCAECASGPAEGSPQPAPMELISAAAEEAVAVPAHVAATTARVATAPAAAEPAVTGRPGSQVWGCRWCGRDFHHPPARSAHEKSCASRRHDDGGENEDEAAQDQEACADRLAPAHGSKTRTGPQTWACRWCEREFSHPPARAAHEKTCQGPVSAVARPAPKCRWCGREFSHPPACSAHEKTCQGQGEPVASAVARPAPKEPPSRATLPFASSALSSTHAEADGRVEVGDLLGAHFEIAKIEEWYVGKVRCCAIAVHLLVVPTCPSLRVQHACSRSCDTLPPRSCQVTRTRNESRHRWADVLFEDGQALVCLDPKKRGILWAKLQHI